MDGNSSNFDTNEDRLSQQEKFYIRGNYNGLERSIKFDTLIPTLKKANFFRAHESNEIEALNAEKRLEYLVFNILLQHGTQKRLDMLCECLSKCGQSDMIKYLQYSKDEAEYSSDEDDEIVQIAAKPEYSEYTGYPPKDQTDDSSSDEEVVKTAASSVVTKDNAPYATGTDSELHDVYNGSYVQSKTKSGPNTEMDDVESESDEEETVRTAGKGGKSEKTMLGKAIGTITKVLSSKSLKKSDKVNAACGRLDEHDGVNVFSQKPSMKNKGLFNHTSAFLSYNKKKPGKGLCVVFALFTGELKGYINDMRNLKSFFGGKLGYDLLTYKNLSREELLKKLKEVQEQIQNYGEYAKLVVVVLSHGEKEGILTCVDDVGIVMEKEAGSSKSLITKIDEIVDVFKHDQTLSLKGKPKLFLFQNCRGNAANVVKAAASPGKQQADEEDDDEPDLHFQTKCPIDGDVMICSASTKNHPSMVNDHTGSWFIQTTMEVFENHYKSDHVVDMMTVVNLAVAELRGALELEDQKMITAVQIPCIFSTYRKKFYLDDPPKKV